MLSPNIVVRVPSATSAARLGPETIELDDEAI